jgi:hypothetical protein
MLRENSAMFAQSLVEYGGAASLSTTFSQVWMRASDWVATVPTTVWYVVLGVLIVLLAIRRAR